MSQSCTTIVMVMIMICLNAGADRLLFICVAACLCWLIAKFNCTHMTSVEK